MRELKLHTALASLTAWGIADRAELSANAFRAPNSMFLSKKPVSANS